MRDVLEAHLVGAGDLIGGVGDTGFNATHTSGDAAFFGDAEIADITEALAVGASAEFGADVVIWERCADHTYDVAIFVAEELFDIAVFLGFCVGDFSAGHRRVATDSTVDEVFDAMDLFIVESFVVMKIETESFGFNY